MATTSGTATGHYNLMAAFHTFVTGSCGWTTDRNDVSTNDHEYIWHAPGLSGGKAIYVGMKSYQNAGLDYYNIKVNGFTGYNPGTIVTTPFETQPGRITNDLGVPLFNQAIPYYFVGNGQRAIAVFNVNNQWESFYLGFFNTFANVPSQWSYPLFVGGMLTSASATRFSDTAQVSWWKGSRVNCAMRFTDGNWRAPEISPFNKNEIIRSTGTDSTANTGYYGIHNLTLTENTLTLPNYISNYGDLDGLYFISGFQNAIENTLTIAGENYIVIRDVHRTGLKDYVALKLA